MKRNGNDGGPQGVDRALTALALLTDGPRSISEMARELEVHRSTALRILRTLEDRGFARRLPDLRYSPGSMLISLGQQALDQIDLRTVASPHLHELHDKTKETVHLAVREKTDVVYIDKIDGQAAVRMWSRVGKRGELHCRGIGKATAAFLPAHELSALADELTFTRYTPTTITTREAFLTDMESIRERGWAIDDGEAEPLVHCIAAPIFEGDGEIAAISLASPVKPLKEMLEFVPDLLATAAAITRDRGGSPRPSSGDASRHAVPRPRSNV
ncbi:IclR family transcriptional regulator [Microbacterium sp.]|jgi:DNA-binding IclR family transcriptional regulator|uniref:IclR family transcriptional regulator n=1 Tax=Microbacterium sp. TaxID=51671 RepID=UPI0037CC38B1